MSQWLPIESAPKDGTRVLVFGKRGVEIAYWQDEPTTLHEIPACWAAWECEGDFWYSEYLRNEDAPTHWQPLPAPPSGN